MNAELVQESLRKFLEVLSFNYPAVGWYFSSEEIEDSFIFTKDKWVCMFTYIKVVVKKGKRIRFSGDSANACTGPAEYFGFNELEDDAAFFWRKPNGSLKLLKFQKSIPVSPQRLFIGRKGGICIWNSLRI